MTSALKRKLPTYYYLDHFDEVIRFVRERYSDLLSAELVPLFSSLDSLSRDARCLLVRLLNRKGTVFCRTQFTYSEISNIPAAFVELEQAGFTGKLLRADFDAFLHSRTKKQLLDLARDSGCGMRGLSAKTKDVLIAYLREEIIFADFQSSAAATNSFAQRRTESFGFLFFLHFGHITPDLTSFTMRDLGLVKTNALGDQKNYRARFDDASAARDAYFFARLADEFKIAPLESLLVFAADAPSWPAGNHPEAARLRVKALTRLGHLLERADEKAAALTVFRCAGEFPASERAIRIGYALEGKDAVESALLAMIENPASDDELLFAEDFYARKYKKKRMGEMSCMLREAPVIRADESLRDQPEKAAVKWYASQKIEAFRTENHFWNSLFGIVFWDVLFGAKADLHSGFDRIPSSLKQCTFYESNAGVIEQRLEDLQDISRFAETIATHSDTLNGVFNWHPPSLPLLEVFLKTAPLEAIAVVLRRMAEDYPGTKSGFPDLMVNLSEGWTFIEIKAEGDQLRRNQLKQLGLLSLAGFGVGVRRVSWMVDPMQDYVVVDIETNGQNGPSGRITEIAVVKVRGGEVIGEWQSLINPGKPITKFVVKLTGITDEMVRDAPPFEEKADSLREFLEGSVFVAHNATFDYGFIRAAYQRMEQPFQSPTLCTKVGMRRFYPGLAKYGLKSLCAEFEIPLESHHRAMCDAKATVGLLKLINDKRMELQ